MRRIHRRWYERLLAVVVRVRRFRCSGCGWQGLRRV
jgi:hypothetical protein